MHRLEGPFRVYVGLVPMGYLSPEVISQTIRDGISFCGLTKSLDQLKQLPRARVLMKSDVYLADDKIARQSYTHPEIVRATATHVLAIAPHGKLTVTAESAHGLPGYRILHKAHGLSEAFRLRGYYELEHAFPGRVTVLPDDEAPRSRYQLAKGGVLSSLTTGLPLESTWRLRAANEVTAARHYSSADYVIYLPKFKSNVLSQGFSGAVKLGNPHDDKGPLNDHHTVDLLEVCNPAMVVSDGIIAAVGGNTTSQRGHELGVILVSNNALAHDLIAAQILNLDPMRINHLRIAMERGWGPLTIAQVEVGGAGHEGVKQLAQKSKFWDVGAIQVQDFPHRFERDNPGLSLPLEILSGTPYEAAGAHGVLLNWLYRSYDFTGRRPQMAKWPRASVCVGTLPSYPNNYVVYAIGRRATQSFEQLCSSSKTVLKIKDVELRLTQLKNGKRHLAIMVPEPRRGLGVAFSLGSFGRITLPMIRLPILVDRLIGVWRTRWRAARNERHEDVAQSLIMTSRLPHNKWWALKPLAAAPKDEPRGATRRLPSPSPTL